MTVEKIIPCFCSPNYPEGSIADSHYGMPVLRVCNSTMPHRQFWMVRCPKCGRGGAFQYRSPYLALKAWNKMQEELKSDILWEAEGEENVSIN